MRNSDISEATRGYCVGREACFHEPGPLYRLNEHALLKRLQAILCEAPQWKEPEATWNYVLGCLLGELSGSHFPETPQEFEAWQKECRVWEAEQQQITNVQARRLLLQEA